MVDSAMDKSAPGPWSGWVHGLLGVIIFSGSLPATRLAVQDMDPLLLTFLRASIAGLLAIALLVGFRQKRPRLAQLVSLIIVSSGVVLGFPATHGAGPAAHHLGAFDCVYWPAAADDRPSLAYCAAANARGGLSGSFRCWAACWWWDSP